MRSLFWRWALAITIGCGWGALMSPRAAGVTGAVGKTCMTTISQALHGRTVAVAQPSASGISVRL